MDGFQDTYRLRDPFAHERPALHEAADRTVEPLGYAMMHLEHIGREAEALGEALDTRVSAVRESPRCFGPADIKDSERLLALASRAADAMEALHVAVFGRRT